MENKIKVAELFAGVGGFRLGLEGWKGKSASSNYKKVLDSNYEIVWSNQWEPSTKVQHAATVYKNKFGQSGHSNDSIHSHYLVVSVSALNNLSGHHLHPSVHTWHFPCSATQLNYLVHIAGPYHKVEWLLHNYSADF